MQRLKDYVSGSSSTPPSADPSHTVRDDLSHAGQDLAHAKDDVKQSAKSEWRGAKEAIKGEAKAVKQAIAGGVEAVSDRIATEAEHAKLKAHKAKEALRDEEEKIARRVKQATATKIFANWHAPFYRDVCADFDVTLGQPLLTSKRLVIRTPDLLFNTTNSSLQFATVHDSDLGNEQLAATWDWEDTFGVQQTEQKMTVQDGETKITAKTIWNRPQSVALSGYAAVPMQGGKPLIRLGADITDDQSNCSAGAFVKQSGAQWLAGYKSRMPYFTVAGYVKSDAKFSDRCRVSSAVASTIFRDTARGSSLSTGLQVDSSSFNPNVSMLPDSVSNITTKIEYDEPSFNIDAKVRTSMYTDTQSRTQGFKVSDAFLRGMYVFNRGQFPRSVLGVTVGVIDGGDLDPSIAPGSLEESASGLDASTSAVAAPRSFHPYGDPDSLETVGTQRLMGARNGSLAALNKPVAQINFNHALNANNRVKLSLSSERALHTSFSYQLLDNVNVQTSLHTIFPSWNGLAMATSGGAKANGGVCQNKLGLSLTIGAM